jgi:autotransporter-associated beta strand protein
MFRAAVSVVLAVFLSIALAGACRANFTFQTPAGINPGQSFNVVFYDSVGFGATSANIADYNAAITSAASNIQYSGGTIGSWSIIGATPTADESAGLFGSNLPVYDLRGNLLASTGSGNGGYQSIGPSPSIDQTGALFPSYPVWTGLIRLGIPPGPGDPQYALGGGFFPSYGLSGSSPPADGWGGLLGGSTENYSPRDKRGLYGYAVFTAVPQPTWTGGGGDSNWSTSNNWSMVPSNGSNLIFSGTTGTSNTNNSLASVGAITFDSTAGSFTLSGNDLTISGDITNNSINTQIVNINLTLSTAQQFNAVSGNLVVNGTIANGGNAPTVTGPSNVTLAGGVSGTGGMIMNGTGTVTVSGNNSYTGGTTVNAGMLVVGHVHGLGSSTVGPGLAINNGATVQLQAGLSGPVQLPVLSIDGGSSFPSSTLDITNNALVVHNGSISTTVAQVGSGLNASGTLWTGPGISSSTAAADAAANGNSTVLAVGAILNVDKNGNRIFSTWPASAGANAATGLTTTDVLAKYTYFGDANLDGVVDNTSDYDLWATGFANPGLAATNPWLYGDFNYDGVVDNTSDYDLWAEGFAQQGGPLSGSAVSAAPSVQSVPEPAGIFLVLMGLFGATWMRRRFGTQ